MLNDLFVSTSKMFLKLLEWTSCFDILQQMTALWPAHLPVHHSPEKYYTHFLLVSPTLCTQSRTLINLCATYGSDPRRRREIRRDTCRYVNTCSCSRSSDQFYQCQGTCADSSTEEWAAASSSPWRSSGQLMSPAGESDTRGSGESFIQSADTVWLCAWWRGSSASKLMSWQWWCGRNVVMYTCENMSI